MTSITKLIFSSGMPYSSKLRIFKMREAYIILGVTELHKLSHEDLLPLGEEVEATCSYWSGLVARQGL